MPVIPCAVFNLAIIMLYEYREYIHADSSHAPEHIFSHNRQSHIPHPTPQPSHRAEQVSFPQNTPIYPHHVAYRVRGNRHHLYHHNAPYIHPSLLPSLLPPTPTNHHAYFFSNFLKNPVTPFSSLAAFCPSPSLCDPAASAGFFTGASPSPGVYTCWWML